MADNSERVVFPDEIEKTKEKVVEETQATETNSIEQPPEVTGIHFRNMVTVPGNCPPGQQRGADDMADDSSRIVFPNEVDQLKADAARKRREINKANNSNAIVFPDEFEEYETEEGAEQQATEAKGTEDSNMADDSSRNVFQNEVDRLKADAASERREINKATDSNSIVFPDEFEECKTEEAAEEQATEAKGTEDLS
ncbi:unnamed protein product [Euphydryas editha]|uniref:Uncharacterized protein n=1 Tax=Euphydryas editha TaxID=104508 RepID=A0AAU9TF99_EUPED|nr:unnamed protein product [Euphydryas editha]